jgi:hypothetical protein
VLCIEKNYEYGLGERPNCCCMWGTFCYRVIRNLQGVIIRRDIILKEQYITECNDENPPPCYTNNDCAIYTDDYGKKSVLFEILNSDADVKAAFEIPETGDENDPQDLYFNDVRVFSATCYYYTKDPWMCNLCGTQCCIANLTLHYMKWCHGDGCRYALVVPGGITVGFTEPVSGCGQIPLECGGGCSWLYIGWPQFVPLYRINDKEFKDNHIFDDLSKKIIFNNSETLFDFLTSFKNCEISIYDNNKNIIQSNMKNKNEIEATIRKKINNNGIYYFLINYYDNTTDKGTFIMSK